MHYDSQWGLSCITRHNAALNKMRLALYCTSCNATDELALENEVD
jgi:hypothetical protein